MDQGGRSTQIFALLIRTVVVYYTQVLQVRIEGTGRRKRYGKKRNEKKDVPSRERKIFVQIALSEAVIFFLTSHPAEIAEIACFSFANREFYNAIQVV